MYQEERTRRFRLVKDYLIKPLTITLLGTWIFVVIFKWSCLTLAHAMSVIALKDRGSQIAKSVSDFRFNRTLHLVNPSLRISKFIPCSFVAAISLCSRSWKWKRNGKRKIIEKLTIYAILILMYIDKLHCTSFISSFFNFLPRVQYARARCTDLIAML